MIQFGPPTLPKGSSRFGQNGRSRFGHLPILDAAVGSTRVVESNEIVLIRDMGSANLALRW